MDVRSRRAGGGVQQPTKAIILNTPNNPTGKVFTRDELETIAALCRKWDVVAISDEIYEHIVYDGAAHVPIATIDGMAERTVTINGLSKTYSVTGWRVGWTISPPSLTGAIRKVHDFLTVGAAAPLQEAGVVALGVAGSATTASWRGGYRRRRDVLLEILERHHFTCYKPSGAYYIMTDIGAFGFADDVAFARLSRQGRRRGRSAGQQLLSGMPRRVGPSCDSASASGTKRWLRPIVGWRSWSRRRVGHAEVSTWRRRRSRTPSTSRLPCLLRWNSRRRATGSRTARRRGS